MKIKFLGMALVASLAFALHSGERPIQPIGYFVETVVAEDDADKPQSKAKFIRDGEEYEAEAGMEVFPGDIVKTTPTGGILVAFLNNNTLQLYGSSEATIHGLAELSAANASQITINSGHATSINRAESENGFNISFGATRAPAGRATGPKPASLDIIVKANGSGGFVTNVAVLAGTVLLTPTSGVAPVKLSTTINSVDTALLTFNTLTNPPSGTVLTGNLTKDQIAALKLGGFASETFLKVGKTSVSIKSTINGTDGSITKGTVTTSLSGTVTKDSWKTANKLTKFSESWSEDVVKGKISVKQSYLVNGATIGFSASLVGVTGNISTTIKATIKDSANKQSYTGTATYNKLTGIITFVTTKAGKDGSTATYTFTPGANGAQTMTAVITGGTAPGTFTNVVAGGAPPATTPDGRGVTQNQPPKSQ